MNNFYLKTCGLALAEIKCKTVLAFTVSWVGCATLTMTVVHLNASIIMVL